MRKLIIIGLFVGILLLNSCVSIEDRPITQNEKSEIDVVGTVTVNFSSFQFLHIQNKASIMNKAYALLKTKAEREHGGNIEIKNIVIKGGPSGFETLNIAGGAIVGAGIGYAIAEGIDMNTNLSSSEKMVPTMITALIMTLISNTQKITATGDVVEYNSGSISNNAYQRKLQDSMANIGQDLLNKIPKRSTIAVLSISSNDKNMSELAVDELEYVLVNSAIFTIVDRARLDQIRSEQKFQMSGDVSDDSAVSIGNMLGANIVITGTITPNGSKGRITIRAIDVKTAQIITMSRGDY